MWPWGHAAVGYLGYALVIHVRGDLPSSNRRLVALLFGTQFPDAIDKPLAWTFGVIPSGRSLAHSLLTATLVIALLYAALRDPEHRRLVEAFGFGYVSHSLTDAISPVLTGQYWELTYLLWPVSPPPDYGTELGFVGHFRSIELTPLFAAELVAVVVAVAVRWWALCGRTADAGN